MAQDLDSVGLMQSTHLLLWGRDWFFGQQTFNRTHVRAVGLMSVVRFGSVSSLPLGNYVLHRRQGRLQLSCCGGVWCRVLESTEEQPPAVVLAGGLEEASGELGGGVVQRKQKVPREAKGVKNGAVWEAS